MAIRNKEKQDKVFRNHNMEAVIRFAANSLVGESMEKAYEYYHNKVYRMLFLLDNDERNVLIRLCSIQQ
jgi:UDP-glucose 4-epimerase